MSKRNVLSFKEQIALMEIVKAEYTSSALNNVDFAKRVNDNPTQRAVFRADITSSHITFLVGELGLEQNRPKVRFAHDSVGDCLGLVARVQALEDQVAKMAAFIKEKVK